MFNEYPRLSFDTTEQVDVRRHQLQISYLAADCLDTAAWKSLS